MMSSPDFNLLMTLQAVLEEGSVVGAARRLQLSPSAMSRALARLRETTGDPLLVRSGRGLVATPRALELRERVSQLVQEAEEVLRPALAPDLTQVTRSFSVRTSDGFVENFGSLLIQRVQQEAPHILLRFLQKPDRQNLGLKDGSVDLETGVIGANTAPELRMQALFDDHFVGVVRMGHELSVGDITPTRYAQAAHVSVSRRGSDRGPIPDEALQTLGLQRRLVTVVGGFASALALAREMDVVATVPARHTHKLRTGMYSFALPVATPTITVAMLWHPRLHNDPVHRWLRQCVKEVCSMAP